MDITQLFEAQRALAPGRRVTFDRQARLTALDALRDMMLAHQAQIVAAVAADFGKGETEALLTEVLPVLQEIAHARRHLRRWMRPRRVWPTLTTFGTSGRIVPQPKGVALIVAPWNFPVNLSLGPLVSALAAGCSAIIKPSELTPHSSALLKQMIEATFPADLVAVVEGGADVSTHLLALPFDHIFFIGSPAVGKIVMAAAAKTLASVTLELGGKSPVIVGPDADVDRAARWISFGKFMNAGQSCVAPDHVYVHDSVREDFTTALRRAISHAYGPDPKASPHFARLATGRHWARVSGLMRAATADGATVLIGGEEDEVGRYLAPTVILNTRADMQISQEEIFGPVLPVIAYSDLSQVLDAINAAEKPLTLYVFGKTDLAQEVIAKTSSGSVGVNLTVLPFIHGNLPFGGIGQSGLGSAHGAAGFRAFTHERSVLHNRFSGMPLLFPPYTARVKALAKGLMKILK